MSASPNNAEELEHDIFAKYAKAAKTFWRELVLIAALILIAGTLHAYLKHTSKKAEDAAWNDILAAMGNADGNNLEVVANLNDVTKKQSKTQAVFYAYVRQLPVLCKDPDETEKALNVCKLFLKKFPKHYFVPQVQLQRGKILMAVKKYEDAIDVFSKASTTATGVILAEMRFAQAQSLHLAGKLEKARELYELVVNGEANLSYPAHLIEQAVVACSVIDTKIAELAKAGPVIAPTPEADKTVKPEVGKKTVKPTK